MNIYESSWIIDATREEVWAALHPQKQFDRRQTTPDNPRVLEFDSTRVEVVHEGDENGLGLVRRCWFKAPWYLGGQARSWEIVSEVRPPELQRYDVLLSTPPDAQVMGWYRLEDMGDGRTRIVMHEEFKMENRALAFFIERHFHDFVQADNDEKFRGMIETELQRQRASATA